MFVLLDLDGTLIDPRRGIVASFEYALAQIGAQPPMEDALNRFVGPPLRASFAELLHTADQATIERAVGFYREHYASVGIDGARVYDGVLEMLAALATDHRVAIATSKARPFAEAIVTHFELEPYVTRVFGAELDGRFDDKGDLIAEIVRDLQLVPHNSVMVGDREHDILAARRHGLRTIGVTYGFGSAEELLSAGADVLASSPSNVARICTKWRT